MLKWKCRLEKINRNCERGQEQERRRRGGGGLHKREKETQKDRLTGAERKRDRDKSGMYPGKVGLKEMDNTNYWVKRHTYKCRCVV